MNGPSTVATSTWREHGGAGREPRGIASAGSGTDAPHCEFTPPLTPEVAPRLRRAVRVRFLSAYATSFDDEGYDDLDYLREVAQADSLQEVYDAVGLSVPAEQQALRAALLAGDAGAGPSAPVEVDAEDVTVDDDTYVRDEHGIIDGGGFSSEMIIDEQPEELETCGQRAMR